MSTDESVVQMRILTPKLIKILCVVISVAMLIIMLLKNMTIVVDTDYDYYASADYTSFYIGWDMLVHQLWADVYNIQAQFAYQQEVLAASRLTPIYIHPPHSAFPFIWLTFFSAKVSYVIWALGNYICLGLFFWQLWRFLLTDWTSTERWGFVAFAMLLPALLTNMMLGNLSVFIALIVLNIWIQIAKQRWYWVGFLLFIGTIKLQLFVVIGMYMLGRTLWKSIGAGVAFTSLAVLVTSLIMGFGIWSSYARLIDQTLLSSGGYGITPRYYWNPRATLVTLFPAHLPTVNLLATSLFVGYALLAFWLGRYSDPKTVNWEISVVVLGGVYFNPHLYTHDIWIMIVGLAFGYAYIRQYQLRHTVLYVGAAVLLYIFFALSALPLDAGAVVNLIRTLTLLPALIYMWMLHPRFIRRYERPLQGSPTSLVV